ncbi:hypothetical protein Dd1591_2074 [Dickeya chrysanthemi Ech1591]|uniref:Uncharacterized protein n=1 Tax=Dickeya chrysanthemi (strain Ech1591) TaxID=561229 RepID=C6CHL9_DICC1|nr:hypothetical protein Dd1591_2074 [Dickeya chrysanthemi Ech1591]
MISGYYRLRFRTDLLTNSRFGIIIDSLATGHARRAGSEYQMCCFRFRRVADVIFALME